MNNKKFLFLLSIPFLTCSITYITDGILLHYYIGEVERDGIVKIILLIAITAHVFLSLGDRLTLTENEQYVPHWIWIVIFPVYLFLRQYKNHLSFGYFAYYWIITFIIPKVLIYFIDFYNIKI